MALINRCCFWKSVRSGSFAAGFYTLILFTIIVTAGVFHLDIIKETIGMLIISLITLVLSGFCVVACVLLLIGLCVDSRMLLIPWLALVLGTTVLDLFVSIYLLIEALFNPFLAILFAIDFVILSLNTYSLICVYSQYQEYCEGRGNAQARGNRPLPPVVYPGTRGGDGNLNRISTDNGVTNTSSVSVTQASVPTGYSEITEESPTQYKNLEEINSTEETEKEAQRIPLETDIEMNMQNDFHGSMTQLTSADGVS